MRQFWPYSSDSLPPHLPEVTPDPPMKMCQPELPPIPSIGTILPVVGGDVVGAIDGPEVVGSDVGADDGEDVGAVVDGSVGLNVGADDRGDVGLVVGDDVARVGEEVGDTDGDEVGGEDGDGGSGKPVRGSAPPSGTSMH